MLFSSHFFILIFLPLSMILYFAFCRVNRFLGLLSIVAASAIFYAWHKPSYLLLMYGSIFINYYSARLVLSTPAKSLIFYSTLAFNVCLLFLFKYLDFFIENINGCFSLNLALYQFPLPLAISFFTFQQIGFLVDVYKKPTAVPTFLEYASFITFYPQLIAGPIVKHSDYIPQIQNAKTFTPSFRNISIGSTIFVMGLFKKTMLADKIGVYADCVFGLTSQGIYPTLLEAWIGVLSYSFQIYFDFSGYSDMAIGLARIFNIHLPINFFSPYKAQSFIDFWKRWHISLSSFLKENIYIPLGGNKKGHLRQYQNLLMTMLIGGLWHGASWTFVIWGGLHGIYLVINHLCRKIWGYKETAISKMTILFKTCGVFLLVSITWVFFRAKSLKEAKIVLTSLFDFHNLVIPGNIIKLASKWGFDLGQFKGKLLMSHELRDWAPPLLICMSILIFFAPNVYEWMGYFSPAKNFSLSTSLKDPFFKKICWKPTILFGIFIFMILIISFGNIDAKNEFIYFQF